MRHVERNYADKPRKLTLATTATAWTAIALSANKNLITANIYRDPYQQVNGAGSRIIDKLNVYYHYKCAYCERIYKMDVEHYRPSKEVRDEQNVNVIIVNRAGIAMNHPGYYWLCYEWSNLLPACPSCNREGGKISRFPTRHHYEYQPVFNPHPSFDYSACIANGNPLLTEEPYLLHPEIDDPEPCFKFVIASKKKGIAIEGIDPERRGEVTADICKLNRDEIKYDRVHKIIFPINTTLLSYIKQVQAGRKTVPEFKTAVNDLIQKLYDDTEIITLDHTLLRKYIVRNQSNFEAIVLPFISKSVKKILLEAFINYVRI
jgi:hypothetical protein